MQSLDSIKNYYNSEKSDLNDIHLDIGKFKSKQVSYLTNLSDLT
jgi:hypothetical protein